MSVKESLFSLFLNRSNKYNYYKNNFNRTNKKMNELKKKLNKTDKKLDSSIDKLKNTKKELKNTKKELNIEKNNLIAAKQSYETKLIELEKKLYEKRVFNEMQYKILLNTKEIVYSDVFNNTIKNSKWLHNKSFSLVNGAANYSFMYLLYRILNELEPKNILELGLGQTTKITTQYTYNKPKSYLLVVENDKNWINIFLENLNTCENIMIEYVPEEVFVHEGTENKRYKNLKNHVGDEKFDFIIVDGPVGMNQKYPRTNIWDIATENLNDEFIIIIDDHEREGEKNTSKELFNILDENNINYFTTKFFGINEQLIICTEKFKSVLWF